MCHTQNNFFSPLANVCLIAGQSHSVGFFEIKNAPWKWKKDLEGTRLYPLIFFFLPTSRMLLRVPQPPQVGFGPGEEPPSSASAEEMGHSVPGPHMGEVGGKVPK